MSDVAELLLLPPKDKETDVDDDDDGDLMGMREGVSDRSSRRINLLD